MIWDYFQTRTLQLYSYNNLLCVYDIRVIKTPLVYVVLSKSMKENREKTYMSQRNSNLDSWEVFQPDWLLLNNNPNEGKVMPLQVGQIWAVYVTLHNMFWFCQAITTWKVCFDKFINEFRFAQKITHTLWDPSSLSMYVLYPISKSSINTHCIFLYTYSKT